MSFSFKLLAEPADLQIDDLANLVRVERMEDHDLVDPVEELGQEAGLQGFHHGVAHLLLAAALLGDLLDQLAADVAGHHDDRVGEIDRVALVVAQPAVVEDLQAGY